jgi:hypothetical protein
MRVNQGLDATPSPEHQLLHRLFTMATTAMVLAMLVALFATATASPVAAANRNRHTPLATLPVSESRPISAIGHAAFRTRLPSHASTTGSTSTRQTSPLDNVNVPIDFCSLAIGELNAASRCSPSTVGAGQRGAIAKEQSASALDTEPSTGSSGTTGTTATGTGGPRTPVTMSAATGTTPSGVGAAHPLPAARAPSATEVPLDFSGAPLSALVIFALMALAAGFRLTSLVRRTRTTVLRDTDSHRTV